MLGKGSFLTLSGQCVNHQIEHCKARTKLQAVKTKLMEKVRATLKLVNEKSPKGLTMTEEDFYKGRFPWLLQFAQSDSDFPDRTSYTSCMLTF